MSFASLSDVRGRVEVSTSSSSGSICELFNEAKKENVIKGQLVCQTNTTSTNSSTGEAGSSSDSTTIVSTSSSRLSDGAIGGISIGAIFGAAALLTGLFVFYRRRGKTLRVSGSLAGGSGGRLVGLPTKPPAELSPSERQELPSSEHGKFLRYELAGKALQPATAEFHGQNVVSEMGVVNVQDASEMHSGPAPPGFISELPATHDRSG